MPDEKSISWMDKVINALITFTVLWLVLILLGIQSSHHSLQITNSQITNNQQIIKQELSKIRANQSIILSNQHQILNYTTDKNVITNITEK